MSGRIFGIFLFLVGAFFFFGARMLDVPFSYDPLGPKAFPLGIGALLCVASIYLILKPGEYQFPPVSTRIGNVIMIISLVIYSLVFKLLGFLFSTGILVFIVSKIFQGTNKQALASCIGVSVGTYILFGILFDVELPMGEIFMSLGGANG